MTIEEAQELWNEQTAVTEITDSAMKTIIKDSNKLDRGVFWRDIRECSATLLVFCAFIRIGMFPGTPSAWYFSAAFVALIPGIYLAVGRIRSKKEDAEPALSNGEHIKSAIKKYKRQEKLLNGVVAWYLFPLFISILLFIVGTNINIPNFTLWMKVVSLIVQVGFALLVLGAVAWLNFRVAHKQLKPKREELEAMLEEV